MNKSFSLMAVAIVSVAMSVFVSPSYAQSPASDGAYCRSMIDAYKANGNARGFVSVGNETAVAIAQCEEGDSAAAIPVFEQRLRDAGIALSAHG